MDKYEFQRWMSHRLNNGRTVAEEIKYVDVEWRDEKGNRYEKELPSFPEAVDFAKSLNLKKVTWLNFWYHANSFGLNYKY